MKIFSESASTRRAVTICRSATRVPVGGAAGPGRGQEWPGGARAGPQEGPGPRVRTRDRGRLLLRRPHSRCPTPPGAAPSRATSSWPPTAPRGRPRARTTDSPERALLVETDPLRRIALALTARPAARRGRRRHRRRLLEPLAPRAPRHLGGPLPSPRRAARPPGQRLEAVADAYAAVARSGRETVVVRKGGHDWKRELLGSSSPSSTRTSPRDRVLQNAAARPHGRRRALRPRRPAAPGRATAARGARGHAVPSRIRQDGPVQPVPRNDEGPTRPPQHVRARRPRGSPWRARSIPGLRFRVRLP